MGITLSGLERLAAPLQSLVGWITGAAPARAISSPAHAPAVHLAASRTCHPWSAAPVRKDHPRRGVRALRVLRVAEACPAPSGAGRMVISGRMADVCAELDRLAALEAAAT